MKKQILALMAIVTFACANLIAEIPQDGSSRDVVFNSGVTTDDLDQTTTSGNALFEENEIVIVGESGRYEFGILHVLSLNEKQKAYQEATGRLGYPMLTISAKNDPAYRVDTASGSRIVNLGHKDSIRKINGEPRASEGGSLI